MAELKVSLYIIKNGETVPIETVPEEDCKMMSERLGRVMSDYYTQHPDEFVKIMD